MNIGETLDGPEIAVSDSRSSRSKSGIPNPLYLAPFGESSTYHEEPKQVPLHPAGWMRDGNRATLD